MTTYLNLDDTECLTAKITKRAPDTFLATSERPQLEVYRHFKRRNEENKEILCIAKKQDVRNVAQIKVLKRESEDASQFFVVQQERSWTTLNISRELFEDLILEYEVFPPFWKAMFTFGRKSEENEYMFPDFRTRRSFPAKIDATVSHEIAYVLRRVELNHRIAAEGQSPWSIRQTAVYHKLSIVPGGKQSSSTFILIAPSPKFESQLSQSLDLSTSDERAIGPWNMHRLLVADSLSGWMDYMSWLEEMLNEQSNLIISAKVGAEKENLSPLLDFNFNFIDRQNIKIIEDFVNDFLVILPTLLGNIEGLCEECRKRCETHRRSGLETCDCAAIIAEFSEYAREAKSYIKRGDALKDKAKSTAQLLSDLLSYEDAITLEKVAKESQKESRSMTFLTIRSTRDAAAVKVLTIISLIYLPTTIVANFFSTQFVHTDETGHMAVAENAWLLAAISLPLTLVTIVCWWAWVRYANVVHPTAPEMAPVVKIVRYDSFRSLRSSRRKHRSSDIERGNGPGTWSTVTSGSGKTQ